ncbi:LytTR family transcriptional regulator DNA-binding domain-containing protein [Paenibacillus polymyxa]|uniref:LytTR family transcriptional regulator DNA-binding domain-containing protein n=1 Tax=Paenibacillus polymyxa TaxID=1406 RepID=UPI003C7A825B
MLTVSKDVDGKCGKVDLPIQDILYMSYDRWKERVIIHTFHGVFYQVGTLKFWETLLNNSGCNFLNVDRSNSINMEKVVLMNSVFRVAYFSHDISKDSPKCQIAIRRYEEVAQTLNLFNPNIVFVT